jgi:transketolase
MPCNAVATATATIAQEHLARLLTDEVVSRVVVDYLQKTYPNEATRLQDLYAGHLGIKVSGVSVVMKNFLVNIKEGRVTLNGARRSVSQDWVNALTEELQTLLTGMADILFQNQVVQAVAAQYAVTEQQYAPNGALVITVNL